MTRRLRAILAAALLPLVAGAVLLTTRPAAAATLTQVTNIGANPTDLNMYVYVPNTAAPRPALLVLVHYCGGSASAVDPARVVVSGFSPGAMATINGWSLAFTLPGGQSIVSGWNATYTPSSGRITAANVSYNATIAPGGSVTVGFQANHTGNAAAPSGFALNGTTCTAG